MSTDSVSPGGRHNGLSAAAYAPLAELDPRLAGALLEALRHAGIAAYVSPVTGRKGAYLDVQLPSSPAEQVWVDAAEGPAARKVLRALTEADPAGAEPPGAGTPAEPAAGPSAADEQAQWDAIVAMFNSGQVADRPGGTESLPDNRGEMPAEPVRGSARFRRKEPPSAAPADEEHYIPPPPPPLPRGTPAARYAAAAVVGGALVLLLPALFGDPVSSFIAGLAVLAVLGGFVALVMQMRDEPPTDSGPDDGAVV